MSWTFTEHIVHIKLSFDYRRGGGGGDMVVYYVIQCGSVDIYVHSFILCFCKAF